MKQYRKEEIEELRAFAFGPLTVESMDSEDLLEQFDFCQDAFPMILAGLAVGVRKSGASGNLLVYDIAWFKTRAEEVGEELVRRGLTLTWFNGERFRSGRSTVAGLLDPRDLKDSDDQRTEK